MDLDAIPDPAQYEAALAAALAAQPDPPAITGYGIVQRRQLVCGVGELANGGRGIQAYRVVQFPLRPGVELVVVFPPNAAGTRPNPQVHMPAIQAVLDRLHAIDRVTGVKGSGPFAP
jgi:hypothetical protein